VTASGDIWPGFDPETTIRDDFDAKILAVLWAAKKTYLPLLWIGILMAVSHFIIVRDPSAFAERVALLSSSGDFLGALLSPFTGVVIAT
jgi:hypothetical protein